MINTTSSRLLLVPDEIAQINQWTCSTSVAERKRPRHTKYIPDGGLSLSEVLETTEGTNLLTGFYVTPDDPYILGDIDNIKNPEDPFDELPTELALFMQTHQTYYEISPSGHGIRFILKLNDVQEKAPLEGSYYTSALHDKKQEAQINIGPPWMTITGKPTMYSSNEIAEVSVQDLEHLFAIRYKTAEIIPLDRAAKASKLPPFNDIVSVMKHIPLDQNPRVQRAFLKVFGTTYQHYEFWLKVLMALHNYADLADKSVECLELAIVWSEQDDAFVSAEDVSKHWKSFNEKPNQITYKTLFKMGYTNIIKWPKPKPQTQKQRDAGIERQPISTEYENFQALLNFYDIKICRDETGPDMIYVMADEDIIEQYFRKIYGVRKHFGIYYGPYDRNTILPALQVFMQAQGFTGIGQAKISEFIKVMFAHATKLVNFVKIYFDTSFEDLPPEYQENMEYYEISTIERLFSCLTIEYKDRENNEEEHALYLKYYKGWLMGIVRALWYKGPYATNNCVLLLTGREQIRKTSHFLNVLPTFMRDKIALTTHGFNTDTSLRDLAKLSANNLILVWDELEQYLNSKTEPHFKKIIDGNKQKMIDKYEVSIKAVTPIAIYGATSNESEFKLSSAGSRRLFHIPVSWVDTDTLNTICWHKIINDLKAEFLAGVRSGNMPWLLTEKELQQQVELHKTLRSRTDLDIILGEMFDLTATAEYTGANGHILRGFPSFQDKTNRRLQTMAGIRSMLQLHGLDISRIKLTHLQHSLYRVCGNYTKTVRKPRVLMKPKCIIERGLATQGIHQRWILPPLREDN